MFIFDGLNGGLSKSFAGCRSALLTIVVLDRGASPSSTLTDSTCFHAHNPVAFPPARVLSVLGVRCFGKLVRGCVIRSVSRLSI